METKVLIPSDPLIDEVRARRRAVFEACGCDVRKFFEMLRRTQYEHPDKVVDRRSALKHRV